MALGPPWAFFDPQRAEGEATLARVVGISGATVPSSGSFLSTASKPCLWIPWARACDGTKGGFGSLRGFPVGVGGGGQLRNTARVRCGSERRWWEPSSPTREPLAVRPAGLPSLGGVASAAAMFRNQELKLPHPGRPAPETLPSLRDPGPPAGSRGNPGPVAAAPSEAPGPATWTEGKGGGGGHPVRGSILQTGRRISRLVSGPGARQGSAT